MASVPALNKSLVSSSAREHFFRQLVDCSSDIITVLDDRGFIRFENLATKPLLGYEPEELHGRYVFDFIHPDDLPATVCTFQQVLSQRDSSAAAEFRFRSRDGSWRDLAAVGRNLLHDPEIAGIIINSRDITQQKRAEQALRESEERFRQLAENIDVAFWVCDVEISTMHYMSPAYEKIWGRTCESLLQSPKSFLDGIYPDDREKLLSSLSVLESGHPQAGVYRIVRPDGGVRWISERCFPVLNEQGKVYRCVGFAEDITEQRADEEQVQKLMLAIDQSPAAVLITDAHGTIEFVNSKFTEMTGYTAAEALGNNPRMLKSDKHSKEFYRQLWETITGGDVWRGEICNKRKDGSLYWEAASVSAIRNDRGEITNFVAVKEDITSKVRDQQQLRLQSAALFAAANSIFITDKTGRITWANTAFCRLSGFAMEELIGKTPKILKSGKHDRDFYSDLWQTILANQVWSGEVIERRKDGELFTVHQTITPLTDSAGEITHFIAVHEDITARKDAESQIKHMAFHDSLTGLCNRAELHNRLKQAMEDAKNRSRLLALHYVDLDRFKVVNDTLGHAVGDALLQAVAQRLGACLRPGDTAARIGGDEFAILQGELIDVNSASGLANRVLKMMAEPFSVRGRDVRISTSIGTSIYPLDSEVPEELLKNADLAMYLAKSQGRNNFQFYTAALNAQIHDRLALESDLHSALSNHEFLLYYQPQIQLQTRRITGVEALIRWQHPTRGLLLPATFIGLAEDCGLIHGLSRWVLEEACGQFVKWQAAGLDPPRIAVNMSPANFRHGDLYRVIADVLEQTQLDPHRLELEVTESLLLEDEYVVNAISRLKELGITLSIDDFGSGYSSLSYLRQLPVERLKIDQSFIRGLPDSKDDATIVRAIIELGHALGYTVIAEGVEDARQMNYLSEHACDEGQGFLFGRPMPAKEIAALWDHNGLTRFNVPTL